MNKSPSLAQITAGIRAVQAALVKQSDKTQKVVLRWGEERKYAAVEIGWQLLRLKEVLAHGMTGKRNAAKIETETVSVLFSQGFVAGVETEFGIQERTGQNYMTAARNAGLTAESTPFQVKALRRKKALAGITLGKLYQVEQETELTLAEQMRQARVLAEIVFMHGRSGIVPRLQEVVMQTASFAHLPPEHIELVYHTLREATAKVAEHRRPALARRAA